MWEHLEAKWCPIKGDAVRNTSTLRYALAISVLLLSSPSAIHSGSAQMQRDPLENSNDVALLERIASADASEDVENMYMGQSGKDHRTVAYARLGAIGTEQSLAAARRVEQKLKATPLLPATVPLGIWPHPMWHFGDSETEPLAKAQTADGTISVLDFQSFAQGPEVMDAANPDSEQDLSRVSRADVEGGQARTVGLQLCAR